MKKLTLILLVAVMLLQAACAAVPTSVISSGEAMLTAAENKRSKYFETTECAYVRHGSSGGNNWAELNWHEILEIRQLNAQNIILKDGYSNNHVMRHGLFKFDLSGLKAEEIGFAELEVRFSSIESDGVRFDFYLADSNWDESTVTWNTAPKKINETPVIKDAVFSSLKKVDVTDFLKDMISQGKTKFTLIMVQVDTTKSETKIRSDINLPKFIVYSDGTQLQGSYVKQIVSDEKQNEAIWDRAKKMYDEWYARYTILKNRPDFEASQIVDDSSEYTKTVLSPGSSPSAEMKERSTRTLEALADFTTHEVKLDKYGGIMNAQMRQEATGFFYTAKIDGRWWVIDPCGYPCYIISISGITTSYQGSPNQKAAFEKSFGGNSDRWALSTVRHLKDDLGFNAQIGSDDSVTKIEEGLVRLARFSVMSSYATKKGINAGVGGRTRLSENNTLPVFDPDFEAYADKRVSECVHPDDKNIIGYISDNELAIEDHMLMDYLTVDPTKEVNYYSYACAWYWLVQMTGKENPTDADITDELADLFRGFIWDRYYYVVGGAIDKYDPNHMYLGTKYLNEVKESEWILKVSGEYLDVITINWYGAWEPQAEYIYDFARYANAPFLVSEFYAKSSDTEDKLASTSGGGFFVRTQEDRGLFYQNYTLRLLESKNCVGWDWFQYADNDPAGNPTDVSSTDANKGIVSNFHKEYTALTDRMKEINQNAYMIIDYFDSKGAN